LPFRRSSFRKLQTRNPRTTHQFHDRQFYGIDRLVSIVTSIIDFGVLSSDVMPLSSIWSLVTFLPSLAMGVRRLHDTDRSGWWWLLSFIPLIGIIVLIVFWCFEGTRGPNRFGPDPLGAPGAA
jgi:uncharacterized membrane protein YhaH (DUF805 family)